ncbi:MAG: hypothetical protein JSW28_06555, partial [Thermoplasmata archaeon]
MSGKVYDKITSLESGGKAVFWNGDGPDDWSDSEDAGNMFKNFLDWSMFIPGEAQDIWVTLLDAPDYGMPNITIEVNATVFNRGLSNATDVVLNLNADTQTVDSADIPLLLPGESERVSLQWTPVDEGKYSVEMKANPLPGETVVDNNWAGKEIEIYTPIGFILVDNSHDNMLFHSRYFQDLAFKKYWINHTSSNLNPTVLANHDVLFIIGPRLSYSSYEVESIKDFVASGNGLLVAGGSSIISDELTSFAEIHWEPMYQDHWGVSHHIASHAVTENVYALPTGTPYQKLTVGGRAEAVIYDSQNDTIQGAASTYYDGNILALIEIRSLSDIFIELNDTKIFGRNIVPWLLGNATAGEHDVSVMDIKTPNFMRTGDITAINASLENHGLLDEYDVVTHLVVNGNVVNSAVVPYLPPVKSKIDETQNLKVFNGTVELLGGTGSNIAEETVIGAIPAIDPGFSLSNLKDGIWGEDSLAVFFEQGTSGPGEYYFSFSSERRISRIRFYQDDEYVATSYRISADTNNNGTFDTVLVEVTDGSAKGGEWIFHDIRPTAVFAVKFAAISGVGEGSLGKPRAYPAMHEFEIHHFEYQSYGSLVTDLIEPQDLISWSTLSVNKKDIDPSNHIKITLLNGSTYTPVSGYEELWDSFFDLSSIDPNIYPSLRLWIQFVGDGNATPFLHDMSISWLSGTGTRSWSEDFVPGSVPVSFDWTAPHPDEFNVSIALDPLSGETVFDNNAVSSTIHVFTPKGYVLVDMGHSLNNTGYEFFYWDIFREGYWINYTYGEITSSLLANHSLFITVNPEWGYALLGPNKNDPEIDNVEAWVNAGGGMFMVGHYFSDQCSGVTKFAGIKWISDSPPGGGETANILPHFVTYGVERLTFAGFYAWLSLSCMGNAEAVVYDHSEKNPTIQGAVSTHGMGRVVALVNYDWFRGSYYFRSDNRIFAMNIFNWLIKNDQDYDLSVRNMHVPQYLENNATSEVTATVWNMGQNDVSNIAVRLLENGTETDNKTITFLAAGDNTHIAFSYTPTSEGVFNVTIEVIALPLENITENNAASTEVRAFTPLAYILIDNSHNNDKNHDDFYEDIMSRSYWVDYSSDTLNLATLSGYDVLITSSAQSVFDKIKEVPAIESFVANGGGLLVLADSGEMYTPLTEYAGITWPASGDFVAGTTAQIDPHPSTVDVSILMPGQSSLVINIRGPAQSVVYDRLHVTVKGAAAKYGNGKIMALAGGSWLSNDNHHLYDSEVFARNIIDWLISPQLEYETSLSNLHVPQWAEPEKLVTVNATLHNWHTDRTDITVEFLVNGMVNQTKVFNFSYGASRLVEFNWTTPAIKQNATLSIRVPPMLNETNLVDNELSAVIFVRPTVGRILFDQSHYADDLSLYKYLMDELEIEGYEVNTTKPYSIGLLSILGGSPYGSIDYNEPATSLKTGRYDALIVPQPVMHYNSYIISEIEKYVGYGGGLLVIGDDEIDLYNKVTAFANISWEYAGAPGDTTDISPHGITIGVDTVDLQCPMARLNGGQSIVRDAEGDTMLAIATKPGRVAAWVDDGSFWNGGILEEDNMDLAKNILRWLTFRGSISLENPQNLTAEPNGTGIQLTWKENNEITIIGYEVRRNATSG